MIRSLIRTTFFTVVALVLVVSPAARAQQNAADKRAQALDAIQRAVAANSRLGTVVAITDRTETLGIFAKGDADLKMKTPLTPDSLFEIGSISKSFTAIAFMQLFDEGRFDPKAPIATYLPWFEIRSKFGPITGHHLLTHTAGLPNYRPDAASVRSATYELRDFEVPYAPGEHHWYSNIGYQTLGYALESIERAAYPEIIRKRIFDRLGMHSSAGAIDDSLRSRLPVRYSQWPYNGDYVEQPWFEYGGADGSIVSTGADMAAYARVILNRGAGPNGRVLSERAFEMLTTPALDNYAYGLNVDAVDNDTVVFHAGGVAGFRSLLEAHMNDGFAVVVLSNAGYDRTLVQWIGNTMKTLSRNQPLPDYPRPPAAPTGPAEWSGMYKDSNGRILEFTGQGNSLSLKQGVSTVVLQRIGRDSFRPPVVDQIFPFEFERQGGKIVAVSHGPDWYVNDSYTGSRSFPQAPVEYAAYVGRYENHNPEGEFVRVFVRKGQLIVATGINDTGTSLIAVGPATFRPSSPDYNPERYRFDEIAEGQSLRMTVSGMPMYRIGPR